MHTDELPMILFTVLSQMSVGAFLALGVLQTVAVGRYSSKTIDRLADPALLAIGPTLVAGFTASMLHMNDVTNTINVLRHWNSSWLSREIIVGMAFAGLGFAFTFMQWRQMGSPGLRRLLALVTAGVGVLLVTCQSMVYYSLVTVPAWHTWATPLRFFGTTILLGSLAVSVALAWNVTRSERTVPGNDSEGDDEGGTISPGTGSRPSGLRSVVTLVRPTALTSTEMEPATRLMRTSLRASAIAAMTVALVIVISLPLYLAGLAQEGSVASSISAETFGGLFFTMRLVLLVIGAVVLSFVIFRLASDKRSTSHVLTVLVFLALAVCFTSEIMGRSIFYESMARIGM